jgi:hypothetical protein
LYILIHIWQTPYLHKSSHKVLVTAQAGLVEKVLLFSVHQFARCPGLKEEGGEVILAIQAGQVERSWSLALIVLATLQYSMYLFLARLSTCNQ